MLAILNPGIYIGLNGPFGTFGRAHIMKWKLNMCCRRMLPLAIVFTREVGKYYKEYISKPYGHQNLIPFKYCQATCQKSNSRPFDYRLRLWLVKNMGNTTRQTFVCDLLTLYIFRYSDRYLRYKTLLIDESNHCTKNGQCSTICIISLYTIVARPLLAPFYFWGHCLYSSHSATLGWIHSCHNISLRYEMLGCMAKLAYINSLISRNLHVALS